ncbi:hypothetical protein FRACYDRAFT_236836 [Fragilariopsis cylindrus CCMP1102]|uniref:Uncharacterized protein n=1 Tax=Fragilariopsis cylindrus CCMP1102 TaxID=635003 RepID=A0A1E7FK55_9STRA|nr:hypothetical protein FRACYDRAFT_236836 [Fragilariopsis cylindrus CCMP1102]|eukprot:OEU18559.1 hypothetical protein FRACYDRAFT_236836 [Fragilariopsis cylindrus CCMP1102]
MAEQSDTATTTSPSPEAVTLAVTWLKLWNEKLDTTFGNVISLRPKPRARYWRFLVNSIENPKVKDASNPVIQLFVVVGIAIHANRGFLPPSASEKMYKSLGVNFVSGSSPATGKDIIDDKKIPEAISRSIDRFVAIDSINKVSNGTRKFLIDYVYKVLKLNNGSIRSWVHGEGSELKYWKKDFNDFAEVLAVKLNLTMDERARVENEVKRNQDEKADNNRKFYTTS